MIGTIYKATNLFTGRVYIGQTTQPFENRKKQHLADKDTWNVFHSAINTWGEDIIEWEVLETYKNKDKAKVLHFLNVAEEFYILKYRSNEERYGYNSTQGGYSSDKFSNQLTARLSAGAGKCMVAQYDLDGNHITTFDSIAEVADFLGGTKRLHRKNLNGYYKGYQWRTISKDGDYIAKLPPYQVKGLGNDIHLLAYSRADGSFVGEFASKNKAMKETGYTEIRLSEYHDGAIILKSFRVKGLAFIEKFENYPDKVKIVTPERHQPAPKAKKEKVAIPTHRVAMYSPEDGSLIRVFSSNAEAARIMQVDAGNIRQHSKREEPLFVKKGTMNLWRIIPNGEEPRDFVQIIKAKAPSEYYSPKKEHRILQYSLGGDFIGVVDSIAVANEMGLDSYGLIRNQCKGKPVYKKMNYQWRYYTEGYPQKIDPIKTRERKAPPKKGYGHRGRPQKSSNQAGTLSLF